MKAIIIGTTTCPFCIIAKDIAIKNNVEYTYKVIDRGEPAEELATFGQAITMNEAIEMVGKPFRSVPQIIVDGVHIGGSEDFSLFLEAKNLDISDFDDMEI